MVDVETDGARLIGTMTGWADGAHLAHLPRGGSPPHWAPRTTDPATER